MTKCTCLFLLSLCLLPLITFSSTFTSQNAIELPTSNKLILDLNGKPLDPNSIYRIVPIGRGAAGGEVYLGPIENSTAPCPNGVFRHNSDVGSTGTPVRFIVMSGHSGSGVRENQDINIQFGVATTRLCVSYTIWKLGDYDVSLGARLLETGGTIGQKDSSWFKIVRVEQPDRVYYNLVYCPGPFVCPSCPIDKYCEAVGVVFQNGKRRLALVKEQPLGVNFKKV